MTNTLAMLSGGAAGTPMPTAFYVMFFSLIAVVAALFMRESAGRPLRGSVPVVASSEEARELVASQDTDERLDTSTMLLAPLPKADDRV